MSPNPSEHGLSANFEWAPDYDALLEQIGWTDTIETEWTQLRDIIKYKLEKNIELYLSEPPPPTMLPPKPSILSEQTTPGGGLKLPPFPPRKRDESNNYEAPISLMNKEQAEQLKEYVFAQLHQFEDPPFTIQRLCELCINPKQQYKTVGKYLRAVEKSILITSTYASFPPLPSSGPTPNITLLPSSTPLIAPATPLFSPIPFLHEDARRSKSCSPPPSPFALNANGGHALGGVEPLEVMGLGLVDELDNPKPGHMSDHPTALTATTTFTDGERKGPKPFLGSLEQRFTKSESTEGTSVGEDMAVDEADVDKENKG